MNLRNNAQEKPACRKCSTLQRVLMAVNLVVLGVLFMACGIGFCGQFLGKAREEAGGGIVPTPYPTMCERPLATSVWMPNDESGTAGMTPEVPTERFVISSPSRSRPADILEEVVFAHAGGGGESPLCLQDYGRPTEVLPREDARNLPMEVEMHSLYSFTCGWQPGERVRMTLRMPDGRSAGWEVNAKLLEKGYAVEFVYDLELHDPPGWYTIGFEGESGSIMTFRKVIHPQQPRLVLRPDDGENERGPGELWLYNWAPHEQIWVFAYEEIENGLDGRLIGWQEYEADTEGQLRIRVSPGGTRGLVAYTAVGAVSGEGVAYSELLDTYFPVLGASILDVKHVIPQADSAVFDPTGNCSAEGPIVAIVRRGEPLEVSSSERVYDGTLWWIVHLADGKEGCLTDDVVKRVMD